MTRKPTGFAYLDDAPTVVAMAHRGGAKHPELLGFENSVMAFEHAWSSGYRYLETDVHATRDGVLLAFHDEALDRVTDGAGRIVDQSYGVVSKARIGGVHEIPRLDELLERFPSARFNIDIKARSAIEPLVWTLEGMNAHHRVCVASFDETIIRRFRRLVTAPVATACGPAAVGAVRAGFSARVVKDDGAVFQVPFRRRGFDIVNRGFVARAHSEGRHVHVWTIDGVDEMHELLDLGVDGIITDRTDVLAKVFTERGLWA